MLDKSDLHRRKPRIPLPQHQVARDHQNGEQPHQQCEPAGRGNVGEDAADQAGHPRAFPRHAEQRGKQGKEQDDADAFKSRARRHQQGGHQPAPPRVRKHRSTEGETAPQQIDHSRP